MKRIIVAFFFLYFICIEANAISLDAQKKYPNVLLSNDYGILNENDLGDFSWGFPKNKRSPFNSKDSGGNYWQCFPRESIKITLEDTGSSSDDFGWKDSIAFLKIEVWINKNLVHEYEMRKLSTVADFEKRFDTWRKIMKGEKYVCLAGDFANVAHKKENGIERDVYGWIFEKIKTNKGCDSYLHSCNPTYQAYLKQKTKEASYKFPRNEPGRV